MTRLSKIQWLIFGLVVLAAAAFDDWRDIAQEESNLSTAVAKTNVLVASQPASRHSADAPVAADFTMDEPGSRVASGAEMVNVFQSKSWIVLPPPPPPPPPPKYVPPPAPTAPALPYAFLGSYHEPGGQLIIFLTRGERIYSVSPGDILENTYHVDDVAAGQLGLTYLPLNIKQTINIGESS